MLDSHPIHLKLVLLKFLYFSLSVFIIFYFGTLDSYAQKPHLDASLVKEGLLELKFKDSWRHQPGDSLEWANPNFDDAIWYNLDPIGLKADQMPDSLWKGYGWWRISFTADPSTIESIERLYFYSWGAAEIYLDGKLVNTYGNFSPDSQLEKTYSPDYDGDRSLKIMPEDTQTLAIRFSHHQAKKPADI
jgi:hypothetical protein